MKIEMLMVRDGIDGEIRAFDDHGKQVNVSRIEVVPYYLQSGSTAPVLYFRTFRETGELLQRGRLILPGLNGRARVADITQQVRPMADDQMPKRIVRGSPKKEALGDPREPEELVADGMKDLPKIPRGPNK